MVTGWRLLVSVCRSSISQPGNYKYLAGVGIGTGTGSGNNLLCRGIANRGRGNIRALSVNPTVHLFGGRSYYSTSASAMTTEPTGRKFRLAVIQLAVGSDKSENLKNAKALIEEAAQGGAKIVGLPECFNSPYGIQYFADYAEPVPSGTTSELIRGLAKQLEIYIIAGSIPELGEDSKLYNTCAIYGPAGELLGKHRKVHLFDIDVPGKMTFQESKVLSPGNSLTVVDTKYCKIGIGICYDMRFPEMAQIYRQRGCDLLVYPGAFNMTTGPAHWQILQQGRAVDNQVFVATIAPARDESASYVAWGHSMIVDPWGKIVVEANETQSILYHDLDLDYLEEVRKQIPVSIQKRPDLYQVTSQHVLVNLEDK